MRPPLEETAVEGHKAVLGTQWTAETERMEAEFWTKYGSDRSSYGKTESCSFPVEVFPPWLRRYVEEVAASCEVPTGVVGFVVLGMLSACYGTHLRVAVKNRYVAYGTTGYFSSPR